MSRIHPQARTTPRTRAEINASTQPVQVLARLYNITVATAHKWHQRDSMEDRSHCPHKLCTVLTPVQEAVVVELRNTLLLPLDDLLAVTRAFLNPAVSRSGLDCHWQKQLTIRWQPARGPACGRGDESGAIGAHEWA